MKYITILGCGPAGLLAAHAVEQAGLEPVIFSKKVKSEIPGSQYFHEPVPGVTDVYPENTVQYIRMGTAEGYAKKVYGDPARPCGWEHYMNMYPSWHVPKAYDRLWDRFESRVKDITITEEDLEALVAPDNPIITTLPAWTICLKRDEGHVFEGPPYWIKPLPVPPLDAGRDIFIYNGLEQDFWYRWSIIGDRCAVESTTPMEGAIQGIKAVTTNCDCWPTVTRAGRWAQWKHGVLLNHAYRDALQFANKIKRER